MSLTLTIRFGPTSKLEVDSCTTIDMGNRLGDKKGSCGRHRIVTSYLGLLGIVSVCSPVQDFIVIEAAAIRFMQSANQRF